MEVLQIGAGRIGKGLNGAVLSEAGAHITFADAYAPIVDLINEHREYPVVTVSSEGQKVKVVKDICAVHILDKDAFTKAVIEADLILTAVGSNILPEVAPHLARGLIERAKQRPKDQLHTIVIACENITDNTTLLKQQLARNLNPEQMQLIDGFVSFPNCVVDRIVPTATSSLAGDNPLAVTVEDYYQWIIDGTALKGPMPNIPGIGVSDNLGAILEQKLFTLNMPHAITAYFGFRSGHQYIHDAIQDPRVRSLVVGALEEVEPVIVSRHPSINVDSQRAYASKILQRFKNPYLLDETTRVGRDPIRKLGPNDRLVRPAVLAWELGEVPAYLATGITGAITYDNPSDLQSDQLKNALRSKGVAVIMLEISGLSHSSPVTRLVKAGFEFDSLR